HLAAPVYGAQTFGSHIGGFHAVDLHFHIVHGLVGDLAGGQQNLPDNVIAVGDVYREALAGVSERGQHRPVGAVAHDEGEQADVMGLEQFEEFLLIGDTDVGDAIGHQHDAG